MPIVWNRPIKRVDSSVASELISSSQLRNIWKNRIAGMAIQRPISVVTRAVEIPPASWSGFGATPGLSAIFLKLPTMPVTVPSSPSIGARAPISET